MSKNYFLNLSAKEAYKAYVRAYESHSLKHIYDVQNLGQLNKIKCIAFVNTSS
jgi:ATP-dependent RNA helicase DDX18/HAS1